MLIIHILKEGIKDEVNVDNQLSNVEIFGEFLFLYLPFLSILADYYQLSSLFSFSFKQ